MKNLLFLLTASSVTLNVVAATVKIESPNTAKTSSSWTMVEHRLFWNNKDQTLCANVTFDNRLYSDAKNPSGSESFVFALPGVKLDPTTKTFYAESKTGQKITLAETRKFLFWNTIVPMPATKIFVFKKSGTVNVVLTADTESRPSSNDQHWIECSDDQWFQNLIRSF